MMQITNQEEESEFKNSYKKYRYFKGKKTDFSELLDFNQMSFEQKQNLWQEHNIDYQIIEDKEVFLFKKNNSILIKKFLNESDQLKIALKCLNEYIYPPYRTNLFIYEKMSTGLQEVKKIYNKQKYLEKDKYIFDKKIRWANIGYQYNWDERNYFNTNTTIDSDLEKLYQDSMEMIKKDKCLSEHIINQEGYKPESCIINYYDETNHMGGHLDDGEPDQSHPIFSYNLGLSAVFLIGGRSKKQKPIAIRLDAGDFYVMSGESRLCYHGVPRIISHSFHYNNQNLQDIHHYNIINTPQMAINYLTENRININFRQVFL